MYICYFCGMAQSLLIDMLYSRSYISGYAVGEDKAVLHNYTAPLAPFADTVILQWSIPDKDIAACGRVES